MIGSGRVGSDSGWVGLARNFVCNFLIGSDFFEFRIKYFGPYLTHHLIGSGRVFIGRVRSDLSGRVARDQVYTTVELLAGS